MQNQTIRKLISFTILFLFSCTSSKYEKGCEQFKTGNFIFYIKGKQQDVSFMIERKDSIQIETEPISGKFSKLSIKWTDSCTYEIKMLETTFNLPDSIQKIRRENAFRTHIISWTKDYYVFRSTRDKSDFVLTDTMWLVK